MAVVWREEEIEAMVFIGTAAVMLVVTFGRIRGLPVGGIMLGFRPARMMYSAASRSVSNSRPSGSTIGS